jgi:hypothetical protein
MDPWPTPRKGRLGNSLGAAHRSVVAELRGSTRQPRPPLTSHQLALEPVWDIQVVTVGLTPLAPTIQVGSAYPSPTRRAREPRCQQV